MKKQRLKLKPSLSLQEGTRRLQESVPLYLTQTLQNIYPLIWTLIGSVCANQVAQVFIQKTLFSDEVHPFWGQDFPVFLETFEPLKSLPYLADVARLEWLQNKTFLAPPRLSLTSDQFDFYPEEIPSLRFEAHPSLALFASPYPLEKIWGLRRNVSEKINLSSQSSWALMIRPQSTIEIYWLTCAEYTFFESLFEGHSLKQSAEKVLILSPSFNFQEALLLAFAKNFFVATYTKPLFH